MTDGPAAPSALCGETRYTLLPGRIVVERGGRSHEVPLDDAADPVFLRLPVADLDDGRPLRRAAFDAWSDHLRASLAAGREFASTYRAPRPVVTGLTVLGAGCVAVLCASLLWSWAFRPDRAVTVEPTMLESIGILVAVAAVLAVIVFSVAGLVRAWRCRRGSYVAVTSLGLRTTTGGRAEPLFVISAAEWQALLRCTRIVFDDGRPDAWVPAEPGAARRLDLVLAALDDRLGESLRRRL